MGWPIYPTYFERILLAQRSMTPRLGSTIGALSLSGTITNNTTLNLQPKMLGNLVLDLVIPSGVVFTIQGSTSVLSTGTISAVTSTNPGTSTRGSITNTAGDAAFVEGERIRLTSGASSGAISWDTRVIAANQANVSRWGLVNPAATINPTIIEPINGVTYAIDTLQSTINQLDVRVRGGGRLIIRDCVISTGVDIEAHRIFNDQIDFSGVYIYACQFSGITAAFYNGQVVLVSCQFDVPIAFSNNVSVVRNCVWRNTVAVNHGSTLNFGRSNCFNGGKLNLQDSLVYFTQTPGDVQFVDLAAGLPAIDIFPGGSIQADANAVAWGADNGALTSAIHCQSDTSYSYHVTGAKPTIPGGGSDVNLGNLLLAYGAIPAVNPANNAEMVVLQ